MFYIHIGFPKTGTTSLQELFMELPEYISLGLTSNNKYLNSAFEDFHEYIQKCKHIAYSQSQAKKYFDASFGKTDLSDKVIISHEGYTMPNESDSGLSGERLKTFFPNGKVLITIRNQADFIRSYYEWLPADPFSPSANKKILSIDNWLTLAMDHLNRSFLPRLKYKETIDWYCKLYGKENVIVVPYEFWRNEPTRFHQQISAWLDTTPEIVKSTLDNLNAKNTAQHVAVHNVYKHYFGNSEIHKMVPEPVKAQLRKLIGKMKSKPVLSEAHQRWISEYYQVSNQELDREWSLNLKEYKYY